MSNDCTTGTNRDTNALLEKVRRYEDWISQMNKADTDLKRKALIEMAGAEIVGREPERWALEVNDFYTGEKNSNYF